MTPGNRQIKYDRDKIDPQIREAGEGMEAMFLDYMMKVMRETVPKSDMDLESPATNIYRSMMDSENAQRAAHAGGVGLADQIIAYLESRQYNLPQGHDTPTPDVRHQAALHGGSNAGEQHNQQSDSKR